MPPRKGEGFIGAVAATKGRCRRDRARNLLVTMPLRRGEAAAIERGKLRWQGPSSTESGALVPNTRKTRQGASATKLVRRPR